ncbi:MAG TPA: protein kinase [Acidobacteriota bacterium]|nr:protein kinase [Acidobacteriota bacterium]
MNRDEMIRKARMKIHSLEEKEPDVSVAPKSTATPPQNISSFRYQQLELIGQGSIGEVFRAYDSVLKRLVALKFLKGSRDGMEERFLREAQSQARVHHDNICKVYEVGEIDHRPFISMQYINGKTLNQAAQEMNLKQKLEVMKKVADAVHAANKAGMIHRDLKPGNILVERVEDGWQPYVTDFGLAREIDAPDLTRTGVVIGTPAYMSPEQASGVVHELDQRTDVYCLGATFYELLCGKPPFEGKSSMEVLWKIIQEEAPLLRSRQPKISEDLQTIVMKCLEKEPRQRYESARALYEDLARFKDDEPIHARPTSWHYRLSKKARKHRAVVAIATVAFAGVILSASFGLYSWWNAAEQAKHAQEFGQEVEKIEGFLRYAQTLPIHDIRKETKLVRERMKFMEKRITQIGNTAKGPGYFALGRGYLALHEYERALIHLEKAWNSNYRTPEVAYALGTVMGELFQKQIETLRQVSNDDTRERRRKEIARQYRDPALSYLRAASGITVESTDYLEGLMALYENKYDTALKQAHQAIQTTPWFYASRKLEGDIYLTRGMEKAKSGEHGPAKEDYEKAGAAYKQAMEIGRSDVSIYEAECRRWIEILDVLVNETIPSDEVFNNGISACDKALQINKENAEAYTKKAIIYDHWADTLAEHGKDSEPITQKAIEMAEAALRWHPYSAEAHVILGSGYSDLGWELYGDGKDTSQSLKKAIESYRTAVKMKPDAESYAGLGAVYSQKAYIEMNRSIDPSDSFRKSISASQKATELDPSNSDLHNNLGIDYISFGNYQFNKGTNPLKFFNSAIDQFQRALQLNPRNVNCYINLSRVHNLKAEYEISQKLDPTNTLRRSIEYCQKALSIHPDLPTSNMMEAYWLIALNMLEENQDPTDSLKEAVKVYDEVIRLRGGSPSVYVGRAELELAAARWAIVKGFSSDPFFANASEALESALKMNPSMPDIYQVYAKYYTLQAQEQIKRGKSAAVKVNKGIENAARAISMNPKHAEAYAIQGELYLLKSEIAFDEAESQNAKNEARKLFQKALELNRNLQYKYAAMLESGN